ncbi:Potassium channel subfamily K member 18 [Papilio machaon]|uniref:Potassium channel subfamily K member 18 n=1 Tax=Papilio machaon TaxID=76193 RepID=A0A0N1IH41_PAPMA|nr:Potassium channel subfamily K member 18 [Papilio machaon]
MPRRRRRLASRIRNYVRSLLAFLFSNIGLIVLVVGYTVAGALMFQAIEGASEIERVNNMTLERNNTAQYLWQNVTLALNLFNETALKYRFIAKIRSLMDFRLSILLVFPSIITNINNCLFYSGYGHLSPRTSWGKVLTIFYALLGMPLFLLYVTNVGQLLARWFKCLYALVCLCRGCPGFARRRVVRLRTQLETSEAESIECPEGWRHRVSESDVTPDYRIPPYPIYHQRRLDMRRLAHPLDVRYHDRGWSEPAYRVESEASDFSYVTFDAQTITVPISVCVAVMVGYIMFGSMIFGLWEKWDQLDGAYFCFISLSSIGFGDFVPGERVYTPRIETSFIVCSLYLMLGIALGAMCFNLMQEQVIHYFAGMKRALKRICRCKR